MAKITWDNRADSGSNSAISASIFNETKASVNAAYDILEAQIGTTSTDPTANLVVSGNLLISGNILPAVASGETTSSFSLGSETAAWKDLFVSTGSIKFVSPGGGVTSFGTSDVDKIKAGKFPVTSRTVGGITFNDWSQNDVIFSSVSDSTRIDLSGNGRMQFIAGNTTYLQMADITNGIFIGNPSVVGPRTTTYLNNTTIIPTGSSFNATGSIRFVGARAASQPPPTGEYIGVMSAFFNAGFGIVNPVDGENIFTQAPVAIPEGLTTRPFIFTEGTPETHTDPGPGKAEYDDGRFIKILADAPFNTGFQISASYNIPFSSSAANNQRVVVEIVELHDASVPYTTDPDKINQHSGAKRSYILKPENFPNGIVTGSFEGEFKLRSNFYPAGALEVVDEVGKPSSAYYENNITTLLDANQNLQLRVSSQGVSEEILDDTELNTIQLRSNNLIHNGGSDLYEIGLSKPSYFEQDLWDVTLNVIDNRIDYQDPWFDYNLNPCVRVDEDNWWQLQSGFPIAYTASKYLYGEYTDENTLEREYIIPTEYIANPGVLNNIARLTTANLPLGPGGDTLTNTTLWGFRAQSAGNYTFENNQIIVKTLSKVDAEWEAYDSDLIYGEWNRNTSEGSESTNADSVTLKLYKISADNVITPAVDIYGNSLSTTKTVLRSAQTFLAPEEGIIPSEIGIANYNPYPAQKFEFVYNNWGARLYHEFPLKFATNGNSETFEIALDVGDRLFYTIKTECEGVSEPGIRVDEYAFNYVGVIFDGLTKVISYEPENHPVSVRRVNVSQGAAFFRLQHESNPNIDALDCYLDTPDMGISQAGVTIANGGFLCVGPLFSASQAEFGGPGGNWISCSADNVVAVGKNNVISKDNSLTVGYGNSSNSDNQIVAGFQNTALGYGSISFGSGTTSAGAYSLSSGNNTLARGAFSHAEGDGVTATGVNSHAEGKVTNATGDNSHAEGNGTQAVGPGSHTEGFETGTGVDAEYSHAEGIYSSTRAPYSHAEGYNSLTLGRASHAEGYNTRTEGRYSHAEGHSTTSSGDWSHAEGYLSVTDDGADYAHAEGAETLASGQYSHTEGYLSKTSENAYYAHAEGEYTCVTGSAAHAEGYYTTASSNYSHAEGYRSHTLGLGSHAEGYRTLASGQTSHAEGNRTNALGISSHAEGYRTTASGQFSHAEGLHSEARGSGSHAEGNNTLTTGDVSHAEGYYTLASGFASHAEGYYTTASAIYSHAEGSSTQATAHSSHAEGSSTIASGQFSHAEGRQTLASGNGSHAEGYQTTSSGDYSHAEGVSNIASGDYSHAEGEQTTASGLKSHTEGYQTTSSGDWSHAEGYATHASGSWSHAEGQYTLAQGSYSHAEGSASIALGVGSHAEGAHTYASGAFSHTIGYKTTASANYAHAGGKSTIATDAYSSVIGHFNSTSSLSGQSTTDLFVIGNGTSESDRSNLVEFATDGIYIDTGSLPTSDPEILGKLYRTGSNFDELRVSLGS